MREYGRQWAKRLAINTLATVAFALAALVPQVASAQTSDKQPRFVQNQQWLDLGNGPTEFLPISGDAVAYTSGATGTGTSAGTTAFTLTGTPATGLAPFVGAVITCAAANTATPCTIPGGTTITAFNGTTGITTSVATTVTAGLVAWGSACPASTGANVPGVNPNTVPSLGPPIEMRVLAGGRSAFPVYSTARICLYGGFQAGGLVLNFPIGAW